MLCFGEKCSDHIDLCARQTAMDFADDRRADVKRQHKRNRVEYKIWRCLLNTECVSYQERNDGYLDKTGPRYDEQRDHPKGDRRKEKRENIE